MIKIEVLENTNIYSFSIDGDFEDEDVKSLFDFLEEMSQVVNELKFLVEVSNISVFNSTRMYAEKLAQKYDPCPIISGCAIVSEIDWLQDLPLFGYLVTNNFKAKHFYPNQKKEAINWLKD